MYESLNNSPNSFELSNRHPLRIVKYNIPLTYGTMAYPTLDLVQTLAFKIRVCEHDPRGGRRFRPLALVCVPTVSEIKKVKTLELSSGAQVAEVSLRNYKR